MVADDAGRLVGHIGFSRVWIRNEGQRSPGVSLAPLAVMPDRCENACGQKRALQNLHLYLSCILKDHKFIVLGQGKKTSRLGCVVFAHKQAMAQAAPCHLLRA